MAKAAHANAGQHWQVSDIKQEVLDLEQLLKARPSLLAKQDVWLQQLQHKLQAVTELPPAAMLELYQVFEKCSLPQSIVESCIEVLDGKALGNEKAGSSRLQQKPQQCDSLVKYLTAEEIGNLETQDMWSGTAILAKRLRLLGVRSMKESTKKVSVALLLLLEFKRTGKMPCADISYTLAQHMLAAFDGCPIQMPVGAPSLAAYPIDPAGLAAGHLQASYAAGQQPLGKDYPELAQVFKHDTVVRGSSKKLQDQKTKKKAAGPCIIVLLWHVHDFQFFLHSACKVACLETCWPAIGYAGPWPNMLQQVLSPVVQTLAGRAGNQQEDPCKLTFLKAGNSGQMPVSNTGAGQLQLTNDHGNQAATALPPQEPNPPAGSAGKQDETTAGNNCPSLMDYEQKAYEQIVQKKQRSTLMKKPAASKKAAAAEAAASTTVAGGKSTKCTVKAGTVKKRHPKAGLPKVSWCSERLPAVQASILHWLEGYKSRVGSIGPRARLEVLRSFVAGVHLLQMLVSRACIC